MKILIVSSCFPPTGWGGAEIAAEGIAKWLAARGHEVAAYVDCSEEEARSASARSGITIFAVRKSAWLHHAHSHGKASAVKKFAWHAVDHLPQGDGGDFVRVVDEFSPDLVMIHLVPGLGVSVFDTAAQRNLPVLFVIHDFWLTCLKSSMFSNGDSCKTREFVCQISSARRWGAVKRVKNLGFWAPSRRIVEITRAHLGSDSLRSLIVERYVVDLMDFKSSVRRSTSLPVRFLYVGKVTSAKGVDLLLQCLKELPANAEFTIDVLGSGDLETSLKTAYEADVRFRFRGVCGRSTVADYYKNSTILLVPSQWFENSPLVIYQAQASGLPVVGADSGGIPELLAERRDSVIVPASDKEAWKSVLLRIIDDASYRKELGDAGWAAAQVGDAEQNARGERVEALCESLVSRTEAMV